MSDCTRCGTPTSRPALSYDDPMSPDPLKDFHDIDESPVNGTVWLCDGCISEFKDFLLGKEIEEVTEYHDG